MTRFCVRMYSAAGNSQDVFVYAKSETGACAKATAQCGRGWYPSTVLAI